MSTTPKQTPLDLLQAALDVHAELKAQAAHREPVDIRILFEAVYFLAPRLCEQPFLLGCLLSQSFFLKDMDIHVDFMTKIIEAEIAYRRVAPSEL